MDTTEDATIALFEMPFAARMSYILKVCPHQSTECSIGLPPSMKYAAGERRYALANDVSMPVTTIQYEGNN